MAAMDAAVEWEGKSRLELVKDIPIKALNISVRKLYGRFLDPQRNLNSAGFQQDWMGIAELMDMDCDEIQGLSNKDEKTVLLIQQWSHRTNATIGRFNKFLEQIQRYDILEHEILQTRILEDVERYHKKQEELRMATSQAPPIQVPEVSSNLSDPRCSVQGEVPLSVEYKNITVGEVETGRPEFFEAFVCYSEKDLSFVKQMIAMLEGKHALKLCIKDRDIIPGSAKDSVVAHLIAQRCKKMIIILSPAFFQCAECDFMTKFGHSLAPGARSKKLIPIVIQQPCPIPDILRYITQVDYTKCELVEWFWWRVARSLQESSFVDLDTLYGKNVARQRELRLSQSAEQILPPDGTANSEGPGIERQVSIETDQSQSIAASTDSNQDGVSELLADKQVTSIQSASYPGSGQPNPAYSDEIPNHSTSYTHQDLTSGMIHTDPACVNPTPSSETQQYTGTTCQMASQNLQSSFSREFNFPSISTASSREPIVSKEDDKKKNEKKKGKKKSKKDKHSEAQVAEHSSGHRKFQFF